jgi:fatty acid desaturase
MAAADKRAARGLFRYTAWDAVPALLACLHLALILTFFVAWPEMSWPARIVGAVLYALAIGWNLDSVSHNFIHNPFFRSPLLNRVTDFILTFSLGTPQTMYRFVHMRHHAGNSDRPGQDGETIDPISIYRYGADGHAEPMLSYVFLQFWRDDGPFEVAKQIRAKRPAEARQALQEYWAMLALYGAMALIHWQFVALLAPFYYLGQCLSMLIAYYEHLGADPTRRPAMGVSAYGRLYNLLFLNNGYHAEHHHQPKQHWTRMKALRDETCRQGLGDGVRVLGVSHVFGFLDRSSWTVPTAKARRAARS